MSGDDETSREIAELARVVEREARKADAAVARVHDETSREIAGLARVVEREGRKADAAVAKVLALDEMVGDLHERVAQLVTENSPVRSWILATDHEAARADLRDLAEWLPQVYLTYHQTRLPSCWAWHPAVVEELLMLRNLHKDAYQGKNWAKVGDWHDKWLPGVRARIQQQVGTCYLKQHEAGGPKSRSSEVAPLAQHLDAVVDAWMSTGLPPVPTTAQIEDARTYDLAGPGGRRDVPA